MQLLVFDHPKACLLHHKGMLAGDSLLSGSLTLGSLAFNWQAQLLVFAHPQSLLLVSCAMNALDCL